VEEVDKHQEVKEHLGIIGVVILRSLPAVTAHLWAIILPIIQILLLWVLNSLTQRIIQTSADS